MGGIASGKSYVASIAAELGEGRLIVADDLAHKALDIVAADGRLTEALGEGFVLGNGRPDRMALATSIFSEGGTTEVLERLSVAIGDPLRIGEAAFTITGTVTREPDRLNKTVTLGPRVFLSQVCKSMTWL